MYQDESQQRANPFPFPFPFQTETSHSQGEKTKKMSVTTTSVDANRLAGFKEGQLVALQNMKTSPELNGEAATVVRFDASVGRWVVRLHLDGKLKAMNAGNLQVQEQVSLDS